jgi:hypothetical protein
MTTAVSAKLANFSPPCGFAHSYYQAEKNMANERNADINAQAVYDDKAASLVAKSTAFQYGGPRTSTCPATDNRVPRAVTVSLPTPYF